MSIITPRECPDLDPGEPLGPGERPRKGRSHWCDPDNRAFIAEWFGHVDAGRIGRNAPVNADARAIVLAHARRLPGQRRSLPEGQRAVSRAVVFSTGLVP